MTSNTENTPFVNPEEITGYRKALLTAGHWPISTLPDKSPKHVRGWQKQRATPKLIDQWAIKYPYAQGTGVLSFATPAIDVDTVTEKMADEIYEFICNYFKLDAPLHRVGRPPKFLVPFHADDPFDKLEYAFVCPEDKKHKIEILANGQQFVAHGIHPETKQPYEWFNGDIVNTARSALPHLDNDQAENFMADIIMHLEKLGCKEAEREGRPRPQKTAKILSLPGAPPAGYVKRHFVDYAQIKPINPEWDEAEEERLRSALAAIPNEGKKGDATCASWERWRTVVSGLFNLPESWNDARLELALEFSKRSRQHTENGFERYWAWLARTPTDDPKTVASIYEIAYSLGWKDPSHSLSVHTNGHDPAPLVQVLPPLSIQNDAYVLPNEAEIPPRQWLLGKHYIRGAVSLSVGAPGRCKSTLVITECVGMAAGLDIFDNAQALKSGPLRVAYFNGEETQEELDRRVVAICKFYNITQAQIDGRLWIKSTRDKPIRVAIPSQRRNNGSELNISVVNELRQWCDDRKIDVAAFDPLVSFHKATENDTDMDLVCKEAFGALAGRHRAVELVHHPRKSAPGEINTTVEDSRGSSTVVAAVRAARVLNFMTTTEATRLGIPDDLRRQHVRVDGGKANMSELTPPSKAKWLRIVVQNLTNGDIVAVVKSWSTPAPLEGIGVADLLEVQKVAQGGAYRTESQSPDWLGWWMAENLPGLGVTARYGEKPWDPAALERLRRILKIWCNNKALLIEERADPKTRKKRSYYIPGKIINSQLIEAADETRTAIE